MSNEISKPQDSQLPAYMQNEEVLGTEQLGEFVRPPRLKIVQAMTKAPLNQHPQGTVVVVPQNIVFSPADMQTRQAAPFKFVPLFFYPEWICTNPLSKQPFVRGRTLDPRDEIARKAKNSDTWFEPCPEDPSLEIAYRECLNFVVMPYEHELSGTPTVMTFSKAGYKDGANLASMIKICKASIFGRIYEATTSERSNDLGQWFGFDIQAADPQWPSEDEYALFKELHIGLSEAHGKGVIEVDYADPVEDTGAESSEF